MKSPTASFVIALSVIYFAAALEEPTVTLIDNKEYLNLRDPVHRTLICSYTLAPGEELRDVSWDFNRQTVFTWSAADGAKASGVLENKIILDRKDPNLEFATVGMELSGGYSCKVTSSLGETMQSNYYQLLVLDISDGQYSSEAISLDCNVLISWSVPAISPKPTPKCGVWQPGHGYTGTIATTWQAVPYFNGSIAYHLEKEPFKIIEMSLDSVIKCQVGIVKPDDTFVILKEEYFNVSKVSERGCSILEVGDDIKLSYENEKLSCRHEVIPQMEDKSVMAVIRCPEGRVPSYRKGEITEVKLYCNRDQWAMVQGYTWADFDNFRCSDPSVVVAETVNLDKKESKQISHYSTSTSELSDETNNTNHAFNTNQYYSLLLTIFAFKYAFLY